MKQSESGTNHLKENKKKGTKEILTTLWNNNINIIPLKKNQKTPIVRWELYQEDRFSHESILKFYKNSNYAAICGKISDNLVVTDFDLPKKWKKQGNVLTEKETNILYDNIISIDPNILGNTYTVKTTSGSLHFYFKLESMDVYKRLKQNKGLNCVLSLERVNIEHLDIQGEGKYVVIPPSSIDGNYYEVYNDKPILKITDSKFTTFLDAWIEKKEDLKEDSKYEDKINGLRTPFKAIASGEINIEEYGIKHDKTEGAEFSYWDAFIRECVANDFTDEEIHLILETSQPNYSYKETEAQIGWTKRKGNKPLTNETLKEVFPEIKYQIEGIVVIDPEERKKLYKIFEKSEKQQATYTRGGKDFETKAFKKWYKNKKGKMKRIKDINTEILLEDIENEISKWDENFKDDKIIYEIFKKIKDENKEKFDKLISLMAKHLKYYDVNKLKRIKIVCEFDDIVKELSIDLDLETITDEEIKRISLEINARRVVILDSLFMWFFFNLGIKEERVRNALLPYIKETTEFIIEKHPCFVLEEINNIYCYETGVYIRQYKTPKDFLEEIILKEIPYNIKEIAGELKINRRIKMVAKEIIARIQINEKDLNFDILNFPNGILSLEDIKNKKWNLKPHDSKYKSILQLTVPFDPSIKNSKEIKPFFIKQLGKEQFLRLMQLYGISLTGTPWKWKAITFLDGKTGTGKSEVIFKTLETLIPPNYISYEPFSNLIVNKGDFALGSLLGSFINIHGDIGEEALSHPEGINKLTEEDIIVNEKYGFKGTIKNRCSHFYAMNVAPQIPKEERLDVFRRIEYLKIIGDSIPENERDPDYFKKIIENDPNEMIAMLNEILIGLSKTLNTGNITPRPVLEKREIYRQASLPLLSFIKKWCLHFETSKETKPNETYLIERHYFLQIYNKYRLELNLEKIENLWALTDEEKKLSYKIYKIQKGSERCYKGIRFNNEAYKHFNINLEEVKEKQIYYPEGILYESTNQTNLTDLIKAVDKNDNVNHSDPERLF